MTQKPLRELLTELIEANTSLHLGAFFLLRSYLEESMEKLKAKRSALELTCLKLKRMVQEGNVRWPKIPSLPRGWKVEEVKAKLVTRGIAGVQVPPWTAIFDVGMFWDPLYQLPYYPGSTVKGAVHGLFFEPALVMDAVREALGKDVDEVRALAKAVVLLGVSDWEMDVEKVVKGVKGANLDKLKESVKKELEERGINLAPNEGGWSGFVAFFDAYPEGPGNDGWLLVPEIITPHYTEAVEEGEIRFAEHKAKPVPVTFLVVERGTTFAFPIAGRNDEDLKIAKSLLKKALTEVGIGAKTTSGYNLFKAL